ncbi:MAG: RsmB/NOP family class I SAM-dependent RNA methyltransferase [Rhodobacteraceae bacterium]|nr:RsmB/NOP family class I SAM-dependent RNA methyltransferase [Paracoccaceae bacterium]
MTPAARYAAAITVLDAFLAGGPVEKILSNWARRNRYAGSKDRAAVRDITFDCLRNLRSYQWSAGGQGGRALAIGHCLDQGVELKEIFSGKGYAPYSMSAVELTALETPTPPTPDAVIANLPDWLLEPFRNSLKDTFENAIKALKSRAPVDLRVNLIKGDLPTAQKQLCDAGVVTQQVDNSPTALRVMQNPRRVSGSEAYKKGLVELQDAASQAVIADLPLDDARIVLDLCAGGGGKTLAMAALAPEAEIFAHDISAARLEQLRERAQRAGASVKLESDAQDVKNRLYDFVLIDVPCSGSGAWRRNPEGKWKLSSASLAELCQTQKRLLETAENLVNETGYLAYVTCSVLTCENEDQIAGFLKGRTSWAPTMQKRYSLQDPGDGFFLAVLKRI